MGWTFFIRHWFQPLLIGFSLETVPFRSPLNLAMKIRLRNPRLRVIKFLTSSGLTALICLGPSLRLEAQSLPDSPLDLATSEEIVGEEGEEITGEEVESEDVESEDVESEDVESEELDSDFEDFEAAIADRTKLPGLFTLYYDEKERQVYGEIEPSQLDSLYLLQSSISRGLGEFGLYRGMPLSDFPITLRRVMDTVEVQVPNFFIRSSAPEDVTQGREDEFFSDSLVFSLPIISIRDDNKNLLVDLTPFFTPDSAAFQDLAFWVGFLGYGAGNSRLETVDSFPLNLEFEATYQFSGGGIDEFFFAPTAIPNASNFRLGVHYSLSEIPHNPDFQPRVADERVGYFLTAYWDLSQRRSRDPFVRYVNRWHLEKQDPTAELSPPKEPIVFWLENTIPPEYRDSVRKGVLAWNSAFEKLGFQDAIAVEQMPDDADWDPADIRYNTIRWTTSLDGGFALGPSRVNPYTGEILDSDILIDENFVRFNINQFNTLADDPFGSALSWAQLTEEPRICDPSLGLSVLKNPQGRDQLFQQYHRIFPQNRQSMMGMEHCYSQLSQQLLSFGALSLSLAQNVLPSSPEMKKFIDQAIQHVTAHEVGHALGLRHNFHGSTHRSPGELQDPIQSADGQLSSSVMDYLPPNLAAPGADQGDYFPLGIGEYDEWAIAYGYTPLDPNLSASEQRRRLKAIADRSVELDYGTDEDAFTFLDPDISLFDLSSDPLTYNQGQMDLAKNLWHRLDVRYPSQGESYSEGRYAFSRILRHYMRNGASLTSFVGGRSLTRYLGGDTPDRYPLEPVALEQQRRALNIISDRIFRAEAFDFPPNLMRKLPPARWFHWAASPFFESVEYPLADQVLTWQTFILADLFDPDRLSRLRDTALKYPEAEPLTLSELFDRVQTAIWDDYLDFESDQTQIPLLQRRLQQQYLKLLVNLNQEGFAPVENARTFPELILAFYSLEAPQEARTMAVYALENLAKSLRQAQSRDGKLDLESQLHLEASYNQIQRSLNP